MIESAETLFWIAYLLLGALVSFFVPYVAAGGRIRDICPFQ